MDLAAMPEAEMRSVMLRMENAGIPDLNPLTLDPGSQERQALDLYWELWEWVYVFTAPALDNPTLERMARYLQDLAVANLLDRLNRDGRIPNREN